MLDLQTFGTLRVTRDGEEVRWPSVGARDLVLCLLSSPGGVGRRPLITALWPEDDPGGAGVGNRFRVTLHRARTALGDPGAVTEEHERFHLGRSIREASDVFRFHSALRDAGDRPGGSERREALRRAVALYRGAYLPDHPGDWAAQARAEHGAAYMRAALELSTLHCEASECGPAVRHLAQALKADPLIGENYHQDLMACLTHVEGKAAAVEHYRRFLRLLREDLSDTPMPETARLAERIKAGEAVCPRQIGTDAPCARRLAHLPGPGLPAPGAFLTLSDAAEAHASVKRAQTVLELANLLQPATTLAEVSHLTHRVLGAALRLESLALLRLEGEPLRLGEVEGRLPPDVPVFPLDRWDRPQFSVGQMSGTAPGEEAHAVGVVPVRDAGGRTEALLVVWRSSTLGAWTAHERELLAEAARTLSFALTKPSLRAAPA